MKNKKVHNSEAPIPGCLGRMVNIFDIINPGIAGHKLITETPHYDGSSLTRSKSDVARSLSHIGDPLQDKFIVSELRNEPLIKTPMKMLIEHEMSKEVEPKHNPTNLVAKLMGLDALPRQQSDSVVHRSRSQICKTNNMLPSKGTLGFRQKDSCDSHKLRKGEGKFLEQEEYNDIYEIWKQAQGKKFVKDNSLQRSSRCAKDIDDEKMALVRRKFVEAKRLVTDEKLRQTKEFQDVLEVLSSNQELLLKCLQDPSYPYTQQMYENYTIPVTAETKRITVLKPAKLEEEKNSVSEKKNEKQAKKSSSISLAHGRSKSNDERSSNFPYWAADDHLPTRIVVLKPSIGNAQDSETAASPNSSSLKTIQGEDSFTETDVCDSHDSSEVAKGIAGLIREQNMGGLSDETVLSSFSNGYTGDESSNYKSDKEYDGESDSEVMSPTSRHSWDYINRFSSPFSSSSCTRPSRSPESSVCREAKRRLSERWAMVASHDNPSKQRHDRRSSSTLGEMLVLSDAKINLTSEEVDNKEKARGSTSCITHDLIEDENMLESPKSLFRSNSIPMSSSVYGSRLNVELSGPTVGKPDVSREKAKPKSTITSFTGKVSSLFFKRNKKVKKTASEEQLPHVDTTDTLNPCPEKSLGKTLKHVARKTSEECSHSGLQEKNGAVDENGAILSDWRPAKFNDNHGQASPISILETPCGEDSITALEFAWNSNSQLEQGTEALSRQLNFNVIDKSPPIGSVSRRIAWKDLCSDSVTSFSTAHSVVPLGPQTEEDWFLFVQALLADIGIDDAFQSERYFFTGWHSPDSPLDPMLREKYVNVSNMDLAYEANRRQWRSSRKLMYDCVNAALSDITRYRLPETRHRVRALSSVSSKDHHRAPVTDVIWTKIKEWLAYDGGRNLGDDGDSNNRLLVELAVKSEVLGKEWDENGRVEIDRIGKEIEEKVLEELVEDAIVSLTG